MEHGMERRRFYDDLEKPVIDSEENAASDADHPGADISSEEPLISISDIDFIPLELLTNKNAGEGVAVSPPKPIDLKQKGIAISHDSDYDSHRGWACILCGNDQKLKRFPECEHCICDDIVVDFIKEMIEKSDYGFKCLKDGCNIMWTVEQCRNYVPREVADCWIQEIRDARALLSCSYPQLISCPLHGCGGLMADNGRFLIRACSTCWKLFCTKCRVDWHMGMSCSQYQALVKAASDSWFRVLG